MMIIENAFSIGEYVYLKTDNLQEKRMVLRITVLPVNLLIYVLSNGAYESSHYEMEISSERDLIIVD